MSGDAALAPVYDNGNAFFNKRSLAQMEKRLTDKKAMHEDACLSPLCAYKYSDPDPAKAGQRINPFTFITGGENSDCSAAAFRFVNKANLATIKNIIDCIPETADGLTVMPLGQKAFYMELMRIRFEQISDHIIKHGVH